MTSPRLGNRNGTPDQPFAWAAREFLRKSVIGKRVTFRVESATPTGREMGAANLEDGTSITALLVSDHLEHRGIGYMNKRRIQRVLN